MVMHTLKRLTDLKALYAKQTEIVILSSQSSMRSREVLTDVVLYLLRTEKTTRSR